MSWMSWASAARVQVAVAREQAKVADMADLEEGTAAAWEAARAAKRAPGPTLGEVREAQERWEPPAVVNAVQVQGDGTYPAWQQEAQARYAAMSPQALADEMLAQGVDPWARMAEAAPMPLESERIAAKRSWMAPSSVAGLCRRLWAWAGCQPAGAQQVAAKVVAGFAAVLVWSYYVTLMIVVVPFFWLAFVFGAFFNHGRRRTLVQQARHRETLEALHRGR